MVEPHERLATALSVAVRVEPDLIRAVRLAVLPRLDVSAEADLWFSPLVQSRGPHGIVFDHDVVARLRTGLASWLRSAPPTDPVHRLGDVIASVHKRLSPALALEERVTWLAVTGRDHDIDAELLPALKALVEENRGGVADWFTAAWHRLPANARQTVTAWKLAQVVRPDLAGAAPPLSVLRAAEQDLDLSDIVSVLPDARMLLRRDDTTLEIGDFEPSGDTVGIMVPDTDPRLLTVGSETVTVRRGTSTRITVESGPLRVSTARGVVYEVAAPRPALGLFLMVGYEADAPPQLLSEDYILRALPSPEHENMSLAVGEIEAMGVNDGPLVLCWRGPEEPERGLSLRALVDTYRDAGGDQLLVLLDTPTPMWTDAAFGLVDALPTDAWIGLATKPLGDGEPLPVLLRNLLINGPAAPGQRQRWLAAGDRLTGYEVLEALLEDSADTEPAVHAGNGTSRPIFRNPLYGRDVPETPTARWLDVSAEIIEVSRWIRSRSGTMLVITGRPGSGKTSIVEALERSGITRAHSPEWLASLQDEFPQDVVIDDLFHDGPAAWLAEITELSRKGMRFIITLNTGSELLEQFPYATVLDLDDVRAHVIRRLSGVDRGMSPEDIATFLIEDQNLSHALVRRTTRELHEHPVSTNTAGWQEQVLRALQTSFDQDLRDSPTSRLLLVALAWAHGPGLPVAEWLACARIVSPAGATCTEDDVRSAVDEFGYYVSSNIRGYRLAHSSLVTHLRTSSDLELAARIFTALADLVPRWGQASSYLRNRLRDHAIDAGPASLPRLLEMATWDSAWRPEAGFVAAAVARKMAGSRRIEIAQVAVDAYTEVVAKERKNITELRSALEFLEKCLEEDGRTREAAEVWTEALKKLPANLSALVDQRKSLRPTPKPPQIKSSDLVVLVPGVKDNVLHGLRDRFAPLPDDLGDERPRGGPADAVLDQQGYSAMLARLHRIGYSEHRGNLLTLPYDWRLSYRLTGQLLGERVEDALSSWRRKYNGNRTAGVVFVCVSTGGLPVRWYVERCGGARITSGVITIGTPVQGSVRALERLVNGTWERGTAAFWRSLPSTYQSLPVYNCIEGPDGLTAPADVQLPGLDPARVANGVAFLEDLLAAEESRQDGLPGLHHVVGVGSETPTTARIVSGRLEVVDTNADHKKRTGSGDTYVPESAAKHPAKETATRVPGSHDLLHRRPAVLNAVAELLRPAAGARLQ